MPGRFLFLVVCFLISTFLTFGQQTSIYTDPELSFKEAKDHFYKEEYSLAYPVFKELEASLRETDRSNNRVFYQEVQYFALVCQLKKGEDAAVDKAKEFIAISNHPALSQKLSYQLGEYYFRNIKLKNAITYYEQVGIDQLNDKEIANLKFHQGYAYFTMQQFDKAKPLLDAIRQLSDDPNYADANYYYGFISYRERNYREALEAFQKVNNHPNYSRIVPFYIMNIYYFQGQKDKAVQIAEESLKKGNGYYQLETKQFLGHAYFERKDFKKALPLLQEYQSQAKNLSREDKYELSYCYYEAGQYAKAVEGFKQLSGNEDSLSQHAMYLLGDAYLKLGQKANARSAFSFCASNSINNQQKEISKFNYAKLSYELGYQDVALNELKSFLESYPNSTYRKEAQELLANVLANTNNYRDALALLEKVESPSDFTRKLYPRVLYGRAMELINDQDLVKAESLLDKVLKDPNNASVLPATNFWKGELSYRQEKIDQAIVYYNAYLTGTPYSSGEVTQTAAKYNLGYCYLRKENYRQALNFFEQVDKPVSLNASELIQDAYLRAADCYFMNKDFQRARSMYSTAINYSWPSSDYATYQTGMIAGVSNGAEKLNILKSIDRKFPSSELNPAVNMEIAQTLLADEKFREAIPYLTTVMKSGGDAGNLKPRALLRLGIAYYNLNNNKDAIAQYSQLIKDYPNSPEADDAIESLRSIYVEEGKPGDFVDVMKNTGRAVSSTQEDSLTYQAAESKYTNNDMNGALNAFNSYLQKFPQGEFALNAQYYSSEIYNNRKDWKNAVQGYDAVVNKGQSKFAERAAGQAARISFFELQDFTKAESYFTQYKELSTTRENRLDAMRGLLRSQYSLKKYTEAASNAQELLREKSISTDDRLLATMVTAKAAEQKGQFSEAIQDFRSVANGNKAALGAEARYEIANCYFQLNDLKNAEKAAFETINKSGSYDFWITKGYILLGDVFTRNKDYFNAKATLQSVVENSSITELKIEAQEKLDKVEAEEKSTGKANN